MSLISCATHGQADVPGEGGIVSIKLPVLLKSQQAQLAIQLAQRLQAPQLRKLCATPTRLACFLIRHCMVIAHQYDHYVGK
jgi:hypothetical protein